MPCLIPPVCFGKRTRLRRLAETGQTVLFNYCLDCNNVVHNILNTIVYWNVQLVLKIVSILLSNLFWFLQKLNTLVNFVLLMVLSSCLVDLYAITNLFDKILIANSYKHVKESVSIHPRKLFQCLIWIVYEII